MVFSKSVIEPITVPAEETSKSPRPETNRSKNNSPRTPHDSRRLPPPKLKWVKDHCFFFCLIHILFIVHSQHCYLLKCFLHAVHFNLLCSSVTYLCISNFKVLLCSIVYISIQNETNGWFPYNILMCQSLDKSIQKESICLILIISTFLITHFKKNLKNWKCYKIHITYLHPFPMFGHWNWWKYFHLHLKIMGPKGKLHSINFSNYFSISIIHYFLSSFFYSICASLF